MTVGGVGGWGVMPWLAVVATIHADVGTASGCDEEGGGGGGRANKRDPFGSGHASKAPGRRVLHGSKSREARAGARLRRQGGPTWRRGRGRGEAGAWSRAKWAERREQEGAVGLLWLFLFIYEFLIHFHFIFSSELNFKFKSNLNSNHSKHVHQFKE
jgi:hypothetical protein